MKPLKVFGFYYLRPFGSNELYSAIFWEIKDIFLNSSELVNQGTRMNVISEIS